MAAAISTHPNRKIRIAIPLLSASSLACPPRSRLQQLLQLLAPEFCHAGGSMAAGVFAGRYQVKPAVLHALEFAFRDSGFRRIAFIVSRIDRQERGLNPFEAGRWVVVARRLPLVKKVIGVGGERRRQALVEELVGLLARGGQVLVRERSSAGRDAEEYARQAEPRRLGRGVAV